MAVITIRGKKTGCFAFHLSNINMQCWKHVAREGGAQSSGVEARSRCFLLTFNGKGGAASCFPHVSGGSDSQLLCHGSSELMSSAIQTEALWPMRDAKADAQFRTCTCSGAGIWLIDQFTGNFCFQISSLRQRSTPFESTITTALGSPAIPSENPRCSVGAAQLSPCLATRGRNNPSCSGSFRGCSTGRLRLRST